MNDFFNKFQREDIKRVEKLVFEAVDNFNSESQNSEKYKKLFNDRIFKILFNKEIDKATLKHTLINLVRLLLKSKFVDDVCKVFLKNTCDELNQINIMLSKNDREAFEVGQSLVECLYVDILLRREYIRKMKLKTN